MKYFYYGLKKRHLNFSLLNIDESGIYALWLLQSIK